MPRQTWRLASGSGLARRKVDHVRVGSRLTNHGISDSPRVIVTKHALKCSGFGRRIEHECPDHSRFRWSLSPCLVDDLTELLDSFVEGVRHPLAQGFVFGLGKALIKRIGGHNITSGCVASLELAL